MAEGDCLTAIFDHRAHPDQADAMGDEGPEIGSWRNTSFEITLRQTGARVAGDIKMLGDERPRPDGPITGTVRGDVFTFARPDGSLRGELVLAGDEMSGTVAYGSGRPLRLQRQPSGRPESR